jgi:hypothetical protein
MSLRLLVLRDAQIERQTARGGAHPYAVPLIIIRVMTMFFASLTGFSGKSRACPFPFPP